MISIKDYAKLKGVSYEAVRKQVKRYESDLEGHIHRQNRTQYLDDEAVVFLDCKRAENPIVIYEHSKDEQIDDLEDQVKQLLIKTAAQADKISELSEWKADHAVALASAEQTRLALEAAEEAQRALEAQVGVLTAVSEAERERTVKAEKSAQEASERARKAESELAAYTALPWFKKLRRH